MRYELDAETAGIPGVRPRPAAALDVGKIGVVRYTFDNGGRDAGTDEDTSILPLDPTLPVDALDVEVVDVGTMGRVVDAEVGLAEGIADTAFGAPGSLLLFNGLGTPGLFADPLTDLPFGMPEALLIGFTAGID